MNRELNVPKITPRIMANENERMLSPPRMKIASSTIRVVTEVLMVRASEFPFKLVHGIPHADLEVWVCLCLLLFPRCPLLLGFKRLPIPVHVIALTFSVPSGIGYDVR